MSYEDNCDGSFIKMPTVKVAEMAQKTLEWIEQRIEERYKKYIEWQRNQIINGFWHRLCMKSIPTDAQIIEYIADDPWCNRLDLIKSEYYPRKNVALRLLKACEYAEEIYISTEDLQRIS